MHEEEDHILMQQSKRTENQKKMENKKT